MTGAPLARGVRRHAVAARFLSAALACVWSLCVARVARASVEDVYGSGGRGPALAGALTAASDGPESTFYNPAALARADHFSLATSATLFTQDLSAGQTGEAKDPNVGVSVGVAGRIPFGGPLENRLFFGFVVHIPTDEARVLRIVLPGLEQAFFLPYENATERAVVTPGLGIRLAPWLRLGAGMETHLLDSPNTASGGLGRTGTFELNTDLKLLGDYVARAGIEIDGGALSDTLEPWSAGVAFRDHFKEDFALPSTFDLGFPATLSFSGTSFYVPRELVAGLAWHGGDAWRFMADVAWEQWSGLPSPRIRVLIAGLDGLLPDPALAAIVSPAPDPKLGDIVSPRLGLEWDLSKTSEGWPLVARAGYAFEPSPGRSHDDPLLFFDARHVMCLGLDWVVGEPWLEPSDPRLEIETWAQVHVLASESRMLPASLSPTAEPMRVTGGGWLGVLGLSLRVTF